jgi:hypothetical protein
MIFCHEQCLLSLTSRPYNPGTALQICNAKNKMFMTQKQTSRLFMPVCRNRL